MCLGQLPEEGKLLSVYVEDQKILDQEEVRVKFIEEIASGDEALEEFLRALLAVDPNKRPSADEALNYRWLSS